MRVPKFTYAFVAMVCFIGWLDWYVCLSFLLCTLVHELGHMLALKLCDVPLGQMNIGITGARIKMGFLGYGKEFLCAAAGPLVGAAFSVLVLRSMPKTAVVGFVLSAVNLLPVYPLDGGRMLRAFLCICMKEETALCTARVVSGVTCCVLMIGACWAACCWQMGLWPVFASLVLLCRVGSRD